MGVPLSLKHYSWEREGEDPWYFEEFSVKKAYPMGINIVTYAMTH